MVRNRVFINALSAKLGGGKTYIHNLLSNLPEEIDVYIVCPDESIIPNSERITYIKSDIANRNIMLRFLWELIYLPFLLNRLSVSVLFSPGGMDFNFFNFGVPKVTMFRNMLPFDEFALQSSKSKLVHIKNWLLKRLMLRTMAQSDHVIFISNYAKDVVLNHIVCNGSSVIYHGISDRFVPDDNVNKENTLLYVSRFESYKNHLNLIKAFNLLDEVLKDKYKLVIIGELMEPSYTDCLDFINNNDLQSKVIIKGKVPYDKLTDYYNSCALFLFPSSCENCPNILLEAIGTGAAILSSSVQPMPEFGRDACRYFDEKDPNSIMEQLSSVLHDEIALSELREESKKLRSSYLWEVTAKNTWRKLIEMVGK